MKTPSIATIKPMAKPKLATVEIANNVSTRENWSQYEDHRARVTELICRERISILDGKPRSLCVLGAGNLNDLELVRIQSKFDSIHLVDLDLPGCPRWIAASIGRRLRDARDHPGTNRHHRRTF